MDTNFIIGIIIATLSVVAVFTATGWYQSVQDRRNQESLNESDYNEARRSRELFSKLYDSDTECERLTRELKNQVFLNDQILKSNHVMAEEVRRKYAKPAPLKDVTTKQPRKKMATGIKSRKSKSNSHK